MSETSTRHPSLNPITEVLVKQLREAPKRIVFAEGEDERVLRVAERLVAERAVVPILLGRPERIKLMASQLGVSLEFVRLINPESHPDRETFARYYTAAQKARGVQVGDALEFVARPQNFAALMVQYGQADGFLAGNKVLPSVVFRAANKLMKPLPDVDEVFSAVLMVNNPERPLQNFGRSGVLLLADCNMIPEPTVDQLTTIAMASGRVASALLERKARVAMLSHSTRGSAKSESSKKMAIATAAVRDKMERASVDFDLIGEVQADVALNPQAADVKLGEGNYRPADVLVFPNLDASHITYKMLRHVGGAYAYGQLLIGLAGPVAQVPRAVGEERLFGTALFLGVEAIKYHKHFPRGVYR